MPTQDEKFMQMALNLAVKGLGNVEPNPAVGCVIVKNQQVIGRGYHKHYGKPHAEINALKNCKQNGHNPKDATLYVTLEPCCHTGKTGPCTQAIINARIVRAVIATRDPAPHVAGKGIAQLEKAGIQTTVGIFHRRARLLNAPFIKYSITARPWTILKWAQSIDGKTALKTPGRSWITGPQSRSEVHQIRRRINGILVGINTVLSDDPLLTARPPRPDRQLNRIVLDGNLRIPLDCQLVKTAHQSPVIIATSQNALDKNPKKVKKIEKNGTSIIPIHCKNNKCDITKLLEELGNRKIDQLMVEGGPTVLASFFESGNVDEIFVYIAPKILGQNGTADISNLTKQAQKIEDLRELHIRQFGNDIRIRGLTQKSCDLVIRTP